MGKGRYQLTMWSVFVCVCGIGVAATCWVFQTFKTLPEQVDFICLFRAQQEFLLPLDSNFKSNQATIFRNVILPTESSPVCVCCAKKSTERKKKPLSDLENKRLITVSQQCFCFSAALTVFLVHVFMFPLLLYVWVRVQGVFPSVAPSFLKKYPCSVLHKADLTSAFPVSTVLQAFASSLHSVNHWLSQMQWKEKLAMKDNKNHRCDPGAILERKQWNCAVG